MKMKKLNWFRSADGNFARCRIPHRNVNIHVDYNPGQCVVFSIKHGHHDHTLSFMYEGSIDRNQFISLLNIFDWIYFKRCYKKKLTRRDITRMFCRLFGEYDKIYLLDTGDLLDVLSMKGEKHGALEV